ncbi:MAG: hypothetical protein ACKN86_01160 [Crocinitomicaceae bacterium]
MNKIDEILNKKFEGRFDVSKELQEKLFRIPTLYAKKSDHWRYWLVAASVLLLMSFHLLSFDKKNQQKEDEIVEVYNQKWNNQL